MTELKMLKLVKICKVGSNNTIYLIYFKILRDAISPMNSRDGQNILNIDVSIHRNFKHQ